MINKILLSLLKTALVALALGTFTSYTFNVDIVRACLCYFIGQFILFYIWNTYTEYQMRLNMEREETKRIASYSKQGVTAECAHCRQENFIPIRMDEINEFECDVCGKANSVYIDVTVAQKASLIDRENLSVSSYIKDNLKTPQEDDNE